MKLYSATLSKSDIAAAFKVARDHGADIHLDDYREWRARDGRYAAEVHAASLGGTRMAQHTVDGIQSPAASWDAWGWFIAELYRRDPSARIGYYLNAGDFALKVLQAKRAGRKESAEFLRLLTDGWQYIAPSVMTMPALSAGESLTYHRSHNDA